MSLAPQSLSLSCGRLWMHHICNYFLLVRGGGLSRPLGICPYFIECVHLHSERSRCFLHCSSPWVKWRKIGEKPSAGRVCSGEGRLYCIVSQMWALLDCPVRIEKPPRWSTKAVIVSHSEYSSVSHRAGSSLLPEPTLRLLDGGAGAVPVPTVMSEELTSSSLTEAVSAKDQK